MFVGRTILRCGVGALVLAAAACGVVVSIDPAPDAGGDGGSDGDAARSDAALDAPPVIGDAAGDADGEGPCTDDMPFLVPPEAVTLSGSVTAARVAAGGTATFLSGHGLGDLTGDQIYEGPFPPVAGSFAPVFDTEDDDSHPAPTPDRKRIYFEMDGGGGRAVATAARNAPNGVFLGVQIVPIGSSGGVQTREPYAVGDGSVLYFTREPGSIGGRDIYRGEQADSGAWSTAVVDVSSGQNEGFPVVSDDELSIYFSRAIGPNGDIFVATRTAKGSSWGIPDPVTGINESGADDRPTWLSPDRCTLLFTSNRAGGTYALYRARRR